MAEEEIPARLRIINSNSNNQRSISEDASFESDINWNDEREA